MTPFEHREHASDLELCASGRTMEEALAEAARGLFAIMVPLPQLRPTDPLGVTVAAESEALLLVEWLAELLAQKDLQGKLFSRFDVHVARGPRGRLVLRATAWGERPDPLRHALGVEVKGISHAGLRVEREDGLWTACCVVDL
jgi:SHS2 domain-containing protein